jgi:tyrosine-specific transport protein
MTFNKKWGGVLLISGTAIGASILALPIVTRHNGFFPTTLAFVICWFFMTLAALLLLEVNLRFTGEKDFISMVEATLGKWSKWIAWVTYLLLLYTLIALYLTGCSAWLVKIVQSLGIDFSSNIAVLTMALVIGLIVSYGTGMVDYINRYFVLGLVISYGILIGCAMPSIELTKVVESQFVGLTATFPVIVSAFGFSVVLPSLTNYLDRDLKSLRFAVIVGSLIPLLVYLIWEFVTLGIIPKTGVESLQSLALYHNDGTGVALALEKMSGNLWITQSSRWFAIFAIVTSLLGVSLALHHFLQDGLKIKKAKKDQVLLGIATFLPPTLAVLFYPAAFNEILGIAGILVAVLLGILPAVMAWRSRYNQLELIPKYRVLGGKGILVSVIAFFSYIIYLELNAFIHG